MHNKLILFWVVLIMVCLNGCSSKLGLFISANIDPLESNNVTLSDGYIASYYKIKKGDTEKTDTLMFFIRGSGHASLNYYLESYLEGLHGNITVYALQKRHVGHRETGQFKPSEEFHKYNHYPQLVKDQKDFISSILGSQNIEGKKIIVFGVSEGGNIAAELTSQIPQITHLMILGSGGMIGIDEFRIWGKRNQIDFDKLYQEVKKHPDSIKQNAVGQTFKYWASILPVDPMKYLKKITIPIFIAIGEKDEMSPVESVHFIQSEFNKLNKQNLTVKIFPDCNHVLNDSTGKNHRGELLQIASKWWSEN